MSIAPRLDIAKTQSGREGPGGVPSGAGRPLHRPPRLPEQPRGAAPVLEVDLCAALKLLTSTALGCRSSCSSRSRRVEAGTLPNRANSFTAASGSAHNSSSVSSWPWERGRTQAPRSLDSASAASHRMAASPACALAANRFWGRFQGSVTVAYGAPRGWGRRSSPRGRGNHADGGQVHHHDGSIPAWAGLSG